MCNSHAAIMPTATAKKIEIKEEANYLRMELSSLGIDCKKMNEFNDKEELGALAAALKEAYFQDYKTAYSNTSDKSTNHILNT